MSVRLAELTAPSGAGPIELIGDSATAVDSATLDSRRVGPGMLFCCVPGERVDGHHFAAAAKSAGAAALLVDHRLDVDLPQVVVADVRRSMGWFAAQIFGFPSERLQMIGVTGTNGKTTVTAMIAAVLERAGAPTGVIGTLTGQHTTPEAPDLQRQLAAFVSGGKRAVAMEVSSHALALHRVDGCQFDVGVFTNLGRDHLDLHHSMDEYFAAKARLFEPARCAHAVVNLDDDHGRALARRGAVPTTGYSIADADEIEVGTDFVAFRWRGERFRLQIGGAFNVSNALAACTVGAVLGIPVAEIRHGLESLGGVPGRFEAVRGGQDFGVVVDFAHTPDGLDAALGAARHAVGDGRVLVVFGAGGDRDQAKRPLMAAAATRWADVILVTSDNPRSEAPQAIVDDILGGVPGDYRGTVVTELDRRQAIAVALGQARSGDIVVIAGKGHETTQTIGDVVYEFDDRAVARQLLEAVR